MSESNNSLREELIENKDDKEYRHGYADENLNATIATQIKVLREQREWKQEDLAKEAGMKQPMISRYENVNYSSWSINTLKKLAAAFDVYLDVRFQSFQTLVEIAENFGRETLEVPPFTEDPFFHEVPQSTSITPSVGSISVSCAPPTLSQGTVLTPQTGSLRVAGILGKAASNALPQEQTQGTPLSLLLGTSNQNIPPPDQAANLGSPNVIEESAKRKKAA
jgi:transcriptional regulator with XRE-family HTH domain